VTVPRLKKKNTDRHLWNPKSPPLDPVDTSYCWLAVSTIQGCSKRSIHFRKFILQVLLNTWRCAIYRLKGELSELFSHITSTRCEPHVWRGNVKSIIQLFTHSSQHVTGNSSHSLSDAPLQTIDIRTLRDFLSIRTQDMTLASVFFLNKFLEVYTSFWITLYM
jgi:hypothetical protein